MLYILFYVLLVRCYTSSYSHNYVAQKLPDLHWNSTNPIFLISNTDHIIDVNTRSGPHQHDTIDIVCPQYPAHTPDQFMEKHIIYNVKKEEYDSCIIGAENPRIIAYCTEPTMSNVFTISFRSFSPKPNTVEFSPGKSYYFISTASPDDLRSKRGGYCQHSHMKVVFKVAMFDNYKPRARARQLQLDKNNLNVDSIFQNSSLLTINNPKTGIKNPDKQYSRLEDDRLPKSSFGGMDSSALVTRPGFFQFLFIACQMII